MAKNENVSISTVIKNFFARRDNKVQMTREQVNEMIEKALHQTGAQQNYYRERAQRSILLAREATASGNMQERARRMRELKMNYAFYRNTSALHEGYHTMKGNLSLMEQIQDYGKVVDAFSTISAAYGRINIDKLADRSVKSIQGVDTTKLESMLDRMISQSVGESFTTEDDPFLAKLVSGEATLDTPYMPQVPQTVTTAASAEAQPVMVEPDNMDAMLNEILRSLNG
ncbi:MAG: hypothetical protein IJ041_07455 [Clostridia bacterium]|nr:hypothetical protein [Clostridia bacterium]